MQKFDNLGMASARTQRIVLLLLVAFFLLLSILSSPGISVTLDEPLHYHYGLFVLHGNTDRIDDSSMPVSALNALPDYISTFLKDGPLKAILERYFIARMVTIVFSAAVAVLVFRWSCALYGFAAALFSTTLYVLDPNIIAHSQLVTTDVFAMGMMTLTFYLLWKFANSRKRSDGLQFAIALGLTQLTKYTAVALFPLALLILLVHDMPHIQQAWKGGIRESGRYFGKLAVYLVIVLAVSTLIINAGFLFNRTLTRLKSYQFQSDLFRSVQADLPLLGDVPMPVPYPYLQGLDWMQHTDQTADRYGNVYLLGRVSKPDGFPGYYFIAWVLKVPIATQIIVIAALIAYFVVPRRQARLLRDEVFLLIPFIFFTIYLNFFFNAQTGIRYYMVVFPLLYIFAGHLFANWKILPAWAKATSAAIIVYLAASVLSYFPYFTPYFNEFVWDKTQTYKYLADSNLEWGQSTGDLYRYLGQHPEAVYDPTYIQPGTLIVSGSDLVGIVTNPAQFAWLRDNFKPVGTLDFAYFIYNITPTDISRLCSTTSYCK